MMSMKRAISILTTVICIMACNKAEVPGGGNQLSAVATIDTQTKTVYTDDGVNAGMKVEWADADSFTAYYEGTKTLTFTKSEAGNTFSATVVPEGLTTSTQFTGLYGSAATLSGSGAITIDFSKQNGSLNNVAAYDVMTSASVLTDGVLSFAFKHKCAIIRLAVKSNDSSLQTAVKKVELNFLDSSISSDFATSGFTINNSTGYSSVTFTLAESIPYGQTKTVYCVIPAISYNKTNYSNIGNVKDGVASKDINTPQAGILAGKVYDASVEYKGAVITNPK